MIGRVQALVTALDHAALGMTEPLKLRVNAIPNQIPTDGKPWVRATLRHMPGRQITLGQQPIQEQPAVLSLQLFVPLAKAALLNPLADYFKSGLRTPLAGIELRQVTRMFDGPDPDGGPWQMTVIRANVVYDQQ